MMRDSSRFESADLSMVTGVWTSVVIGGAGGSDLILFKVVMSTRAVGTKVRGSVFARCCGADGITTGAGARTDGAGFMGCTAGCIGWRATGEGCVAGSAGFGVDTIGTGTGATTTGFAGCARAFCDACVILV